jgi:hypothetical protein
VQAVYGIDIRLPNGLRRGEAIAFLWRLAEELRLQRDRIAWRDRCGPMEGIEHASSTRSSPFMVAGEVTLDAMPVTSTRAPRGRTQAIFTRSAPG